MKPSEFFINPATPAQRQYEALKAFYCDGFSAIRAADKFGFSPSYFKKLRFEFSRKLKNGENPFFPEKRPGPKKRVTSDETLKKIVALRKQNYAITDIKSVLEAEGKNISLETVDNILKAEGFAPLPKRTRRQRLAVRLPEKIEAPHCVSLEITDEEFTTETGAGPLVFLPLLEDLGIISAIRLSGFPQTNTISDIQSVLSFLALKLTGGKRWSHDTIWNMDRALGFFAKLNVLPKSGTLSTYSYRVTRPVIKKFLTELCRIFPDDGCEFNLDFKAIPHWGDKSVLEKNWSGTRTKAIKSLLSLIVHAPSTGYLTYTNAEIKRNEQNEAVFDFIDFWKRGGGESPKLLVFDSKFTTYENLDKLNQSKEKIKFLTLRRRGKKLVGKAEQLPADQWQKIKIRRSGGRKQSVRVNDGTCKLKGYKGEVRQVIMTDHGREKPAFLITNDFDMDLKEVIQKYARRCLVEQEIAE
ncbi:MAG: hypothetical protein GY710_26760, partial [Desulfobacteraceae bacterium]|nr:hypothetical protein [Desulfobacteraceae bacterium]